MTTGAICIPPLRHTQTSSCHARDAICI